MRPVGVQRMSSRWIQTGGTYRKVVQPMLRTVNRLGDRLLGLLVPQATASAVDCGTTYACNKCRVYYGRRLWHDCDCWTNSNCAPINCTPRASTC